MTRQSRLLLTIGILAVGGVVALGMIANRYSLVLERRQQAQDKISESRVNPKREVDFSGVALRQVDAFIEVRTAVERAKGEGAEALDEVRRKALAEARVREADYLQVAEMYREWRGGAPDKAPRSFQLAFERRREELEALDLD